MIVFQGIYFNNYLYDPKRPQLPEHPSNRPGAAPTGPHPSGLPLPTPMAAQPLLTRPPQWLSSMSLQLITDEKNLSFPFQCLHISILVHQVIIRLTSINLDIPDHRLCIMVLEDLPVVHLIAARKFIFLPILSDLFFQK